MKALRHFIVKTEKAHKDTIKLGNQEIFLDSRFDEFANRICYGEVVSPPHVFDTGAKKGDTLFFHHHVTTNPQLTIGDSEYVCTYEENIQHRGQAIAYRKKNGDLRMLGGWMFVQPIEISGEDVVSESGIITSTGKKGHSSTRAKVFMPSPALEREGVKVGDVVGFDKNADYKMELDDGQVVFRMRSQDISYVVKEG